MAEIYGTCGHKIESSWFNSDDGHIAVKSQSRDGSKAVDYILVCEECLKFYELSGLILKTSIDVEKYLDGPDEPALY